jgi:hypothetical protein
VEYNVLIYQYGFVLSEIFHCFRSLFFYCVFWDIIPCSPLKVNRRFGIICQFHLQGRRISHARNWRESRWQAAQFSHLAYTSTLKMEATYSSETSVDFQGLHSIISQKIELHNYRCENFKSYILMLPCIYF